MNKLHCFALLFASLINLYSHADGFAWSKPATATLFAPGSFASEQQAAKYCSWFQASTGRIFETYHGNQIFDGHYCMSCNFAEIVPSTRLSPLQERLLWQLASRFTEKIIGTRNNHFHQYLITDTKPKDQRTHFKLQLSTLNFGQEADVQLLSAAYDRLLADPAMPEDIVLFGLSRGAAAAFNFIATHYETKPQKRIKAIVLEGCFESPLAIMPASATLLLEKSSLNFKRNGMAPRQKKIMTAFVQTCHNYHIPVLFICSKTDELVSYRQCHRLIVGLKRTGLDNLYFIQLYNSSHAGALFDNQKDRMRYHRGIHAFYRLAGLSHIPNFANAGGKDLWHISDVISI